VRVAGVSGVNFRCYERVSLRLAPGLVGVLGPNGAGKTSLVELIHFGCLGYSPRTSAEGQLVRFGADFLRSETAVEAPGALPARVEIGFRPGEPKRVTVDGAPLRSVERLLERFPVLVFTPDRLRVVKGAPALRRAYFDRALARLWPVAARATADYGRALAQRNHLLRRLRAGAASEDALDPWDAALARSGADLAEARRRLAERLERPLAERLAQLGDAGEERPLRYLPSVEGGERELAGVLRERRRRDVERGSTGAGPHMDDFQLVAGGRDLRHFGSQGEQRRALLCLVLAEADLLRDERDLVPLLLLDDVTSELDRGRRRLLLDALSAFPQALVTTTEDEELVARAGSLVRVDAGRLAA
jgi:DNA replication and repair protein RecF